MQFNTTMPSTPVAPAGGHKTLEYCPRSTATPDVNKYRLMRTNPSTATNQAEASLDDSHDILQDDGHCTELD